MKILVTGATGTVGGHVARLLADATRTDLSVRALVRDPAKAADHPGLAGVELVAGDLTNPDDVRRALAGVDRVFLNMADDNGVTFAAVAGEVAVKHVVLLSSFSVVYDMPSGENNIVAARHRGGEQALTAAGVPATFLRAAGFDYNIGMWLAAATDGVVRTPFADVPLPIVHPADIAAAAVAVLTADSPKAGAYLVTGPEKVTIRQQVQILNDLLGRSMTVESNSWEDAKAANFPAGTPDFVATSLLEILSPAASVVEPSDDVRTLTGTAPAPSPSGRPRTRRCSHERRAACPDHRGGHRDGRPGLGLARRRRAHRVRVHARPGRSQQRAGS